jgi:hypothetical protein
MRGAFAFFMLLSACFLYAEKNLSVSVETGGGILFGETHEYVVSESDKIISRLDFPAAWMLFQKLKFWNSINCSLSIP